MKRGVTTFIVLASMLASCAAEPKLTPQVHKEWSYLGAGVYLTFDSQPDESEVVVRIDNVPDWIDKETPILWKNLLKFLKCEPTAWVDEHQTLWILLVPDFEKINFIANRHEKIITTNGASEKIYISISDNTDELEGQ